VRGIYEDQAGILWIGSDAGLDEFNPQTGEWKNHQNDPENPYSLSDNFVTSILEDKNGFLWIGTAEGGLNKLDKGTGRFIHFLHDPEISDSLSNNEVLSLLEERLVLHLQLLRLPLPGHLRENHDRQTCLLLWQKKDPRPL
jgi:ligand-binding sensor domain-containing protein